MNDSRSSPATYVTGRSATADIVLDDPTVSRQHAELGHGTSPIGAARAERNLTQAREEQALNRAGQYCLDNLINRL